MKNKKTIFKILTIIYFFAYGIGGLILFAFSGMCYDGGDTPEANQCMLKINVPTLLGISSIILAWIFKNKKEKVAYTFLVLPLVPLLWLFVGIVNS